MPCPVIEAVREASKESAATGNDQREVLVRRAGSARVRTQETWTSAGT